MATIRTYSETPKSAKNAAIRPGLVIQPFTFVGTLTEGARSTGAYLGIDLILTSITVSSSGGTGLHGPAIFKIYKDASSGGGPEDEELGSVLLDTDKRIATAGMGYSLNLWEGFYVACTSISGTAPQGVVVQVTAYRPDPA